MDEPVRLDALRDWIGRTETASDLLTQRLVQAFNATLDRDQALPEDGDPAPWGIEWCLAPPIAPSASLGPDGHPARGGFLPPVTLPRRMWAGAQLSLQDRLRVGDRVERTSVIADIQLKHGRSGTLCFVAVDHVFSTPRGLACTERHDIVYRAFGPAAPARAHALPVPEAPPEWRRPMRADPVLLFRYSALTFNGHRIHYDRPYARDVESYPDLVVHGPLQASWLLDLAGEIRGSPPASFGFRGLLPLFDTDRFALCARSDGTGLALWVETEDGRRTMQAEAAW